MRLTINGEAHTVPAETTIAKLIEHLKLRPERLAVEVNRQIIRRTNWAETTLREDDSVEIVHFVGGG